MIMITLKKGNHSGEVHVRRGRRKTLYKREKDSIKGPHEKVEIQSKVLRRGKTWPSAKIHV